MTHTPRAYNLPLSHEDLMEIRARAQHERRKVVRQLTKDVVARLRASFDHIVRSHPAAKPDAGADPYVNAAR